MLSVLTLGNSDLIDVISSRIVLLFSILVNFSLTVRFMTLNGKLSGNGFDALRKLDIFNRFGKNEWMNETKMNVDFKSFTINCTKFTLLLDKIEHTAHQNYYD